MTISFPKVLLRLITSTILLSGLTAMASTPPIKLTPLQKELAALEKSADGKIGIDALDTANHQHIQYRATERFPMGCTSKVIGVSAVLKRSMTDKNLLQQKMNYTKADLLEWAPITKQHLTSGMTVAELCSAAISYSDNTAMNLLVKKLGGLQALNNFARSIGDRTFRADHGWPQEALSGGAGNVDDSTTPAAMASSLQKIALGNILAQPQREQLLSWLKANTTGNARIRAGVPKTWAVGDKTGTGTNYGTTNDIAIIWPPHCNPLILAVYFTHDKKTVNRRDDIVAKATRLVWQDLAKNDQCIRQNS